ncbi:lysine transporter LysE [Amorphoplanes nipponensis]|uniref:Lysine transporter LysE n=1 Tax=Actinoplanes nipponensis TaxID=135950 RepID=A0A919J9R1_9ACTN|nr:LysE family transporter [Actinoplanes nipponensis]GIE46693.1 lysine transporter LysE [Actinoplanes nipponensis]
MSAAFWAGVVAGYGVAVPVGAIAVLIAGLTARTSLRVGAAAGLGAASADGVYALIAVLGGAALAAAIQPIATPLRWAAAVILVLLAAHTARAALRKRAADRPAAPEPLIPAAPQAGVPAAAMTDTTTPTRAYLAVLGLTLLNPATVVYFAALVLGRGGTGGGVWFVAGAFLASASWQLLIAGGGALVGRLLTGERGRLITALVSSAVIAVLALALVA